jgi:DNA topoisomerase-1
MVKLVIVESPGKIKKIKSYLGSDYNVMASVGHIRDLAKDNDSIDIANNFTPTYEITKDKITVVRNLKSATKTASEIIIASDGDREGEAIAYHLISVLGCENNYKRIIFHEITKNAILKALEKPTLIDMNMFYAQQARRILDRIVGYKLSPILKSINGIQTQSLGAGRVQSVVTRLIVDRENEINNFFNSEKSSIYNINGDFTINKIKFKGSYINYNVIDDIINLDGFSYNKLDINKSSITKSDLGTIDSKEIISCKMVKSSVESKDQIKVIVYNIKADPCFIISSVSDNERQRHPAQPFITSSLQQEASYKLKFKLKDTMQYAQRLYEKGLITYMRTDSPTLSAESLGMIKKHILEDKSLGEEYYQFRQFKAKGQNAQEAHEAIRPTHFNIFQIDGMEGSYEEKLYQLIWNRTIASQMKSATYHDQHIVLSNTKQIQFEGTNSVLIFDGYLRLYNDNNEDSSESNINNDGKSTNSHIKINTSNLLDNKVEWKKITFKETFSNPPTRYNEPSLVKKLEGLGIGRPSTYAAIISKIQEHKYIKVGNIQGIEKKINTYILEFSINKIITFDKKSSMQKVGNEKLKLLPTEDGILVTNYLIKNFPQIMDYKFTKRMEELLDDIAEGKKVWHDVLSEYYQVLKQQFDILGLQIENKYYKKTTKLNTDNLDDNSESNLTTDFDSDSENNSESKSVVKIVTDKLSLPIKENKIEQQIIGKHPKYGDIIFMIAKFGPVFKINYKINKDLFVSAGKLKPTDANILENAIKYIDYKINTTNKTTNTANTNNKTNRTTNKSINKFIDI